MTAKSQSVGATCDFFLITHEEGSGLRMAKSCFEADGRAPILCVRRISAQVSSSARTGSARIHGTVLEMCTAPAFHMDRHKFDDSTIGRYSKSTKAAGVRVSDLARAVGGIACPHGKADSGVWPDGRVGSMALSSRA